MRYPYAYGAGVIVAALVVAGFYFGGPGYFALPIATFLLMPLVEHWRGVSRWPSSRRLARLSQRTVRRYDRMLVYGALASALLLGWALWAVSVTPLAWWEFAGFALSMGVVAGLVGIAVSHELLHRGSRFAFPLMATMGYSHYCVEHLRGHHVLVATPEDAATARRGEPYYAFVPRTIAWGLRTAWRIERLRLARAGHGVFSFRNRILVWHGFTLTLVAAIAWLLGPTSVALFVIQGAIGVSVLAAIDYIEHYGLLRAKLPDGRYERIGPAHAWNCDYLITNVATFNLGRHTAHHERPGLPYYRLRTYPDAPQLPHGYSLMLTLALIPPLWFRVMDRELAAWSARTVAAPA
ncbi:MAG: alkane 1-monooxygenase [Sphingomonadaceae bacterium]|nr:alkane 1-monooxygenase [Sphingomonadaceae bacterium]